MDQIPVSRSELWRGSVLHLLRHVRRALPFALGVFAALLALLLYNLLTPQPHELTIRDVNDSVAQQPPAQGQDTTPPSVKAQISADVIYYSGKGCNPTSVTVTAYVTDNVAVAQANIYWYYAPEGDPYHAQTALMSGSGNNWSYTINPSQTGTIAYWVEGWDTSNNHAQSQGPNTVAVVDCQEAQPPPVVTTEVPPPPQDTTPPTINAGGPSPDPIYPDSSCGPTQTSAKVSASDESGVAAIYVNWQYSPSGSGGKDDASSGYYTFPAPIKGDTTLTYWFEACDVYNNCGTSKSFSATVSDCVPAPP